MVPDADLQLSVVIKALSEVVAPAVDPANRLAVEQLHLSIATIGRSGAATEWGGYSGIFIDPDGHPWEVAHNPFWTISEDGGISL